MSAGENRTVLIATGAYDRLAPHLKQWRDALLVMDDAACVRRPTDGVVVEWPHPSGAWYSEEVWQGPARNNFLDYALQSHELRWLHAGTAGLDAGCYKPFIHRGVPVTTSHGFAPGIADFVLAGVLDHWQRGPARRRLRANRAWRGEPFRELAGSRWLIIGFGAIGEHVARRACAFGAQVTGVRRRQEASPFADAIIPLTEAHTILPDADVVVFCASLNGETRGIGDAAFFARMKPGATFVNVARGGMVHEPALIEGLANGRPGHAILDVFVEEPLPQTSPLWSHPNVAMTAHSSWMSDGARARNDASFIDNLDRFLSGQPLVYVAGSSDVERNAGR